MSNRNMNLDIIVRLKDLLSGPLRGLRGTLEGVASMARKIGVVGAAVAGITFLGPMQEAAAFQQQLIDIAGTSNLVGAEAFAFVDQSKARFEQLGLEIGQYSDTVAKGAGQMIAAGVSDKLVDASIGTIGKAATAANAEMNDMASVATSLLTTLKLPAEQLDDSLGALVTAGKLGSFELKDMAKYFPTLTGQMAKFGVTGREAVNTLGAALQIARKGTSDPAEAANNLKNFLSKILAPVTIKNFADMGVDIEGVMQDAVTKGINPIEAVIQKITKLTGVSSKEIQGLMKKAKDAGMTDADALGSVREQLEKIYGAGKLGGLFSDMQVMDFLIPMLGNIDEYKSIKDEVAKATGSAVDADFETQMQGLNRQLTIFKEIGTQGMREVGLAFGTWMPMINGYLMDGMKWLRELDASTGGMVKQGMAFAGVAVLVAVGLGALGIVLPVITAGFSVLLALFSPLGVALAAIAAGGLYLYRNWATYAPRLSRLWDGVVSGTGRMMQAGRDLVTRYGPMIRRALDFSGLTLDNAKIAGIKALDMAMRGMAGAWAAMKDFGTGFAPYLSSIGDNAVGAVKAIGEIGSGMWRLARALAALVNIDMSKASGIFTWIGGFAGGALEVASFAIRTFYEALADLVNTMADLAEGKRTLESLIPKGLAEAWRDGSSAINDFIAAVKAMPKDFYNAGMEIGQEMVDGIKAKFDELVLWFKGLPGLIKNAIGKIDVGSYFTFPWSGGSGVGGPPSADNENAALPAQASPSAPAGTQRLDVQTNTTVEVKGPGKVVDQNTSVTSPSSSINTGRAVGRD